MSADGPLINLIILILFGIARHQLIFIQIQSIFYGLFGNVYMEAFLLIEIRKNIWVIKKNCCLCIFIRLNNF